MMTSETISEYRLVVHEADMFTVHEAVLCWLEKSHGYTYFAYMTPNGLSSRRAVGEDETDIDACIAADYTYKGRPVLPAPHAPGEYHPRIHRNGFPRSPETLPYRASWRAAGVAARKLADLLAGIFGVVEPIRRNANACGHELRQLLVLAAMEVESAWRGVLEANYSGTPQRPNTKDYIRLKLPMRLREWRLRLAIYDDWPDIAPFANWDENAPTKSLGWYNAYNQTKHDREAHLDQASLHNVVEAVAALHVMMFAQYGEDALAAFGLPALTSFEIVDRPKWAVEELYFGGREATGTPRPLG